MNSASSCSDASANSSRCGGRCDGTRLASSRASTTTLEAALAQLPLDYRLAFILKAVEGHSIAETAELLGLSFAATASRLRRASQQFVRAYETLNGQRGKSL